MASPRKKFRHTPKTWRAIKKKFCKELTELLHEYKVGIADDPHVYFLELEDGRRKVKVSKEGVLKFI